MHQIRLATLLLSPSLMSSSIAGLLTLLVLGIANWSYITPENPLYEYIFGKYGLTTVLQNSSNSLSAISSVFNSPSAYNVAVIVVAIFIGLMVYVLLEGMDHVTAKAEEAVKEVRYVSDAAAKASMKKEAEIRVGLRAITLLVWVCYFLFFIKVVIPYTILLGRIDPAHLLTLHTAWNAVTSFTLLIFAFHIHVIFMRLLALRPRVFGGQDVVINQLS